MIIDKHLSTDFGWTEQRWIDRNLVMMHLINSYPNKLDRDIEKDVSESVSNKKNYTKNRKPKIRQLEAAKEEVNTLRTKYEEVINIIAQEGSESAKKKLTALGVTQTAILPDKGKKRKFESIIPLDEIPSSSNTVTSHTTRRNEDNRNNGQVMVPDKNGYVNPLQKLSTLENENNNEPKEYDNQEIEDNRPKRKLTSNKNLNGYQLDKTKTNKGKQPEVLVLEIGDKVKLLNLGKSVGSAVVCDSSPSTLFEGKPLTEDYCVLIPGSFGKKQGSVKIPCPLGRITTLQGSMHKKVKWPIDMLIKCKPKLNDSDDSD